MMNTWLVCHLTPLQSNSQLTEYRRLRTARSPIEIFENFPEYNKKQSTNPHLDVIIYRKKRHRHTENTIYGRKNLQQLYAELSQQAEGNPIYEQFLTAVAAANEKIKQLHNRDRFLRAPLMTEQDKQELLRLYGNIGRAAEPLIKQDRSDNEKDLTSRITALAAGEHRALTAYDPQKPRTLPSILEDARTLTVDTRGLKLKDALTGRACQRQPLTFVDDRGARVFKA